MNKNRIVFKVAWVHNSILVVNYITGCVDVQMYWTIETGWGWHQNTILIEGFKKSLGPTVVTCEEVQMQSSQAVVQGIPHFPHHSDTKLQSTPMQHLAEAGGRVIVSVTVQA